MGKQVPLPPHCPTLEKAGEFGEEKQHPEKKSPKVTIDSFLLKIHITRSSLKARGDWVWHQLAGKNSYL